MSALTGKIKAFATWTLGILSLVLIVAYLAGAFHQKIEPSEAALEEEGYPSDFVPAAVALREEKAFEMAPGTIAAKHETVISSRILAVIEEMPSRSGDAVKQGDALAILDSRDLEARESQAGQQVLAARAQLDEAHREYVRATGMLKENAIPVVKFTQAEAGFRVASAQLESSQKALSEATVAKSYARILSPMDGIVIDRLAEPGDTIAPGAPLMKLYAPNELRLEAYVRESLAMGLKRGDMVKVRIDALNQEIEGRVVEIAPQADPGSRAFLVKAGLPENKDLFPGMFGRLSIETAAVSNLRIPAGAVHTVGQLQYVHTTDGKKITGRRFVTLGEPDPRGEVRVLSGLSEGEQVAVLNQPSSRKE